MLRRLGRRIALVLAASSTLVAGAAFAQGFHSVHTPDGAGVWAVGDGGVAYFSTDGGQSYASIALTATALRGVTSSGLTVIVVGDAGKVFRSSTGGGNWTSLTLSGSPGLKAVEMVAPTTGWLVGAAGTIQKTTDGGASWTPQTSGVAVTLNAVRFADASNGWAVGDGGTVLHTTNGGSTWTPVAVPTSNRLLAVDVSGARVWATGVGGTCIKSTNGGANWAHVNLKLDTRSDVRAVRLAPGDSVYVGGGGGFVRRSVDDGASWTFLQHSMHARLTGLTKFGSRLYMCSDRNRVVFRTSNAGATWTMPTLATHSKAWVAKQSFALGTIRGGTIAQHPANPHSFYAVQGNLVIKSLDEGETWALIDTIPGMNRTNTFIVSPKDSNAWVAATRPTSGTNGRIMRSTDAGLNWTTPLIKDYSEYGIVLEMHPDRPDTLYYGVNFDGMFRSTDFGASWAEVTVDSSFRSPCDIVVVPDSGHIVIVGDGVTGSVNPPAQYYKSVDGGVTFTLMHSRTGFSGSSEIPGMACSRLEPGRILGTNWFNGGIQRSTDFGSTWPTIAGTTGLQLWGVAIARDDPNFALAGLYSTAGWNFSTDGGLGWTAGPVPSGDPPAFGSNDSYYMRDRELVLAEQSTAIWKLNFTYSYTPGSAQTLTLFSPNGGEEWTGGSVRNITWGHQNLGAARIEYRKSAADPWQLVADVPGYQGSYAWTVPNDFTFEASIRITDLWDGVPTDQSDNEFTIVVPMISPDPASLDFGSHAKHTVTTLPVTIENTGSGTLSITAVTTTGAAYTEGRGAFSIAVGNSDTIGVSFRPKAGVSYSGTLQIHSNASGMPVLSIPLAGVGLGAGYAALPDPVDLGTINPGATAKDTLRFVNVGNVPLTISSIASDHAAFFTSRTSLVVPAGGSDTVRVFYHPTASGLDTATFSITASDTAAPHTAIAIGEARANVAVGDAPPAAFALLQNQPNPFGGSTQIRYALPAGARVTLEVFDLRGQRVATLVNGWQESGRYAVPFGGGARALQGQRLGVLHSGVYFYRLTAGEFTFTRKMLYVK